jgi:hypothetical protein
MKNLKILLFGILLVSMHMTSCKKDADQQFQNAGNQPSQQDALAQNNKKFFEKSITIYNADKTKSTTLRFRAASKKALENVALDKIEFTLVKSPEPKDLVTSTIPGDDDEGYSASSGKNAPQSTNEEQALPGDPGDAIQVDLPLASKTEPIFIKVNSKAALNNGTMRSATGQVKPPYWWDSHVFYSGLSQNMRKENLHYTGSSHLDFYPYYYINGSGWVYQAPWHSLTPSNRDASYKNCYHAVGADCYWHSPKTFTLGFYPSCGS